MSKEIKKLDALLEIGTEEIPVGYVPNALEYMKNHCKGELEKRRLSFEKLEVMGTPRRLALVLTGLPPKSESKETGIQGPSREKAVSAEGQWTPMALGFARSMGVSPEDLKIVPTKKGDYVSIIKKEEGVKTEQLLKELFQKMIPDIPFPKKMAWNETRFKFARPIRNILALYGTKPLSFSIAGVKSSQKTFGLFHLSSKSILVKEANDYPATLKNHCILVHAEERKKTIQHYSQQLAHRIYGQIQEDEGLLEDIVWMVEHPVPVLGNFDPEFLALPQEILTTCMRKQLKFFSILDSKGKLLPHFIAIRNGTSEHQDTVRKGYEKVLTARLSDARFFFNEDLKKPLEHYRRKAGEMTFQEKLGSTDDKIGRMKSTARALLATLGDHTADLSVVERAMDLCKFDLATSVVFEFTELQGIMGEIHALRYGEDPRVARAIREHYYPLTSQGKLPESPESCLVALSEKIVAMTGSFLIGQVPSGSADPFGLRRQSTGILRIILEKNWDVSLTDLVRHVLREYQSSGSGQDQGGTEKQILQFLTLRLQLILAESGFEPDEINAVTLNHGNPDVKDLRVHNLKEKVSAVHSLRKHPDFEAIAAACKRTGNILKQAKSKSLSFSPNSFSENLLKEPEERELHSALFSSLEKSKSLLSQKKYPEALSEWVLLRKPLDLFFEKVLVMDPDANLCLNRLSLLSSLEMLFKEIADFSQIQQRSS